MAQVENQIKNDAEYASTYPIMRGSGSMEATQEIHIFLADLNPDDETLERYNKAVAEWNDNHPELSDKMKNCYLCLVFRDADGNENPVRVLQSARYIRSNDSDYVVQQCHQDANYFVSKGFTVIREKIEATSFGINGIPTSDEEMRKYPKYFEAHIKIGLTDRDSALVTDEEIEQLRYLSKQLSDELHIPVPLSYNQAKKDVGDCMGFQRFMNVRARTYGRDNFCKMVVDPVVEVIKKAGYRHIKTINEYVWYDSYPELDKGWIDYTDEELMRMNHLKI